MIKKLASYDQSVSVQAAAVLTENSVDVEGPEISEALTKAALGTKRGFEKFIKELKANE